MPGARVARVMIDTPVPALDHLFDYGIADELAEQVRPGVRVRVPLRSAGRVADAYVIEVVEDSSFDGTLSPIDMLVSAVPVLTPEVWELARRVADRAAGTASDIVRLAVPKRQVRVEKKWVEERERAAEAADLLARTRTGPITGYPADSVERVLNGGRAVVDAIPRLVQTPHGAWVGDWARTAAQLASRVAASGRQAIIAVPDYRDQDQLEKALAELIPVELISRLDARQPNAERYRAFLDCLTGGPRVIIGNRSAIYAPAPELGLILLWDDADDLHSELLAPYVHTRDAALIRQESSKAALILLGHTRSIEAQRLVEIGWLEQISPERVTRPRIILSSSERDDQTARMPSSAWSMAREAVADGPILVQVARPGYAPVVACKSCSTAARCTTCHGPLGIGTRGSAPSCGLCGAIAASWSCLECSGRELRLVTRGTGRTSEELGRAFPGVPVIVSDGSSPRTSVSEKPAIVIATRGAEPIADGGYRATLLLDGERMLARESLDIALDCLRWWSNAAALARDGAPVLLVGVDGALGQTFATWTQPAFASAELADRKLLGFPPAVRTASVTGSPEAVAKAISSIERTSYRDVLGPAEVPGGGVRSIVRFDYGHGADVAKALRAAIITNAASRRRVPAAKGDYRQQPSLRVRFDETEIMT